MSVDDKCRAPSREFERAGPAHRAWLRMEALVNGLTTPAYNPLYFLGAISIALLLFILVSGIYLFLFYSISAKGAYASVEHLSVEQWYLGGVMRSLHRYSSDLLVIFMALHAARSFALDRYKHWRWLAWVTGVLLAWVIVIGGIFGYWMVWDEKARLVATLSAQLLENIPIFGLPMSLNFARAANLTDQLFYIVLFIHFSTIFFIFIAVLVHLLRVTKAVITPPRPVVWALFAVLLALSFIKPALSSPAADLKALPADVAFDWFYMFIFPFLRYTGPLELWGFIVALTLVAAAVPWLTRTMRPPAVALDLASCTGCELCMEDCPYQAIQMRKRTDGTGYALEAVVNRKRCASCGICVGSCDYKALSLPDISEQGVKAAIRAHIASVKDTAGPRVLVFACVKGAWTDKGNGGRIDGMEGVRVVRLPCIGMLQPSMLSIPFEKGSAIDGVFVASCREGDCSYRRGDEWFAARLSGTRAPAVGKSVDRARVRVVHLSAVEQKAFGEALIEFVSSLGSGRRQ